MFIYDFLHLISEIYELFTFYLYYSKKGDILSSNHHCSGEKGVGVRILVCSDRVSATVIG